MTVLLAVVYSVPSIVTDFTPTPPELSTAETVIDAGSSKGIKPIGLGARDSLRIEMGYCLYGNEIDDDWVGPREPTVTSIYVNDKFEAGDLVISAGVRIDNFMMDDWKMNDPANPGWDQTNQGIIASEFSESDVKTVMQPRIGFAFPVSDETVFHLQYGNLRRCPSLTFLILLLDI